MKATEMRMTVTLGLIIGSYIACWAPLVIVFLIIGVTGDMKYFRTPASLRIIQFIALLLSHFNPALNPFIYAYRISGVRNTMKKVLGMRSANEDSLEMDVVE
jgi:7 transmembrane receptor (rhodopsin family)